MNYLIVLHWDGGRYHHRAPTLDAAKHMVNHFKPIIAMAEIFLGDDLVYCWGLIPTCP